MAEYVYIAIETDEDNYESIIKVFKDYEDAKKCILERAAKKVDEETYIGGLTENDYGCGFHILYKDTATQNYDIFNDFVYMGDLIESSYMVRKEAVY